MPTVNINAGETVYYPLDNDVTAIYVEAPLVIEIGIDTLTISSTKVRFLATDSQVKLTNLNITAVQVNLTFERGG